MTMFLNSLRRENNLTTTENGAVTNTSSLDPVVDFFGLAGAMRDKTSDAADLFEKAFNADPQTAVRTLFYLRDVRGGQGERDVFRAGLARLKMIDPSAYTIVLPYVAEYGRWDDLLALGVIAPQVVTLIRNQLHQDLMDCDAGKPVSLLAKWLPSENTTCRATVERAKFISLQLGYGPGEYRKILSKLRKRIHLLEQDMSANRWEQIDFAKLPSQAHRRHTKAFMRHVPERYQAYLESVKRGEKKINVSTVYPYEIFNMVSKGQEQYANVAWENLPDYTQGNNALVMADVSGSMVRPYQPNNPIAVSVSLALYFAERNKGPFHNYFMTFSGQPELVQVQGSTLIQRMRNIQSAKWQMNTNMLAAFRAILKSAVMTQALQSEMPSVLYVISDMEFDSATGGTGGRWQYGQQIVQTAFGPRLQRTQQFVPAVTSNDTVFETAKREFAQAGYKLPHVVFWNVHARNMQTPATVLDGSVSIVSGLSPQVFGMAVQGKSPRELVDSVVNSQRYERIVL